MDEIIEEINLRGFSKISLNTKLTKLSLEEQYDPTKYLLNSTYFNSSQETFNTFWMTNAHIGSTDKSNKIRNLMNDLAIINTLNKYLGENYWLKCTRLYTQRIGFMMNFHHDKKESSNNYTDDKGLIFLIPINGDDQLGFEVIPGSHKWEICKSKSVFSNIEIKNLIKVNKAAKFINKVKIGEALVMDTSLIHRDPPYFKNQLSLLFNKNVRSLLFIQFGTIKENSENIISDNLSSNIPIISKNYAIKNSNFFPITNIQSLSVRTKLIIIFTILQNLPNTILKSLKRWFKIIMQ